MVISDEEGADFSSVNHASGHDLPVVPRQQAREASRSFPWLPNLQAAKMPSRATGSVGDAQRSRVSPRNAMRGEALTSRYLLIAGTEVPAGLLPLDRR